jgi:hypothetical protein
MNKYLVGAAFVGVLAFSATGASAAVVCNGEGDCWHAKQKYDYHPDWVSLCMTTIGHGRRAAITGGANTRVAATGIRVFG